MKLPCKPRQIKLCGQHQSKPCLHLQNWAKPAETPHFCCIGERRTRAVQDCSHAAGAGATYCKFYWFFLFGNKNFSRCFRGSTLTFLIRRARILNEGEQCESFPLLGTQWVLRPRCVIWELAGSCGSGGRVAQHTKPAAPLRWNVYYDVTETTQPLWISITWGTKSIQQRVKRWFMCKYLPGGESSPVSILVNTARVGRGKQNTR